MALLFLLPYPRILLPRADYVSRNMFEIIYYFFLIFLAEVTTMPDNAISARVLGITIS